LTPRIAKRAYEIYEERGHKGTRAVQDWEKAEREIRKADATTEPAPDAKAEPKPDATAEPKPDAKAEPKPDAATTTAPDVTPRTVTRVRQLYEQLGREDVRSVEEWEKAEREKRNDKPKK